MEDRVVTIHDAEKHKHKCGYICRSIARWIMDAKTTETWPDGRVRLKDWHPCFDCWKHYFLVKESELLINWLAPSGVRVITEFLNLRRL